MTTTPYDRIADWYDEFVREGPGDSESLRRERSSISTLMGDIGGQQICDLACGQGRITRWLARAGASVVGVDISERLLEIARRDEEEESLGITYVQDDAQRLGRLSDHSFDGVVCTWSLVDIEDMTACFASVARVLRPEGWFVFLITHPCFDLPGSRAQGADKSLWNYFEEGFWRVDNPGGVKAKVGSYHRTLSTYVNGLAEAGLMIERMIEPQGGRHSVLDTNRVPGFLFVRCRSLTQSDILITAAPRR